MVIVRNRGFLKKLSDSCAGVLNGLVPRCAVYTLFLLAKPAFQVVLGTLVTLSKDV